MARDSGGSTKRSVDRTWQGAALAAIGMVALSAEAFAVDWTVGGGIGVAPDYEGSEEYEPVPLWNVTARDLYHPQTYAQIVGTKFNSNLVPHENFRAGLSAEYKKRRGSVENNSVDDLRATDDGFLLGGMVGYDHKLPNDHVVGIGFDARFDVQDDIGGLMTLSAKYDAPFDNGTWLVSGGVDSTYATDDYMDNFFEIKRKDAARSGLDRFSADDGFKDIGFRAGVTYKITEMWSTSLNARYSVLLDDAADSPVTDDEGTRHQFFAGLSINYSF